MAFRLLIPEDDEASIVIELWCSFTLAPSLTDAATGATGSFAIAGSFLNSPEMKLPFRRSSFGGNGLQGVGNGSRSRGREEAEDSAKIGPRAWAGR